MIVWLKILHIATLAIWSAGLMELPALFAMRPVGQEGPALWRLQRFARFCFIRIVSPSAYVAIGSGIALIFAGQVFDPWFALKLLAVGMLAGLHVRAGFVVVGVFRRRGRYSRLQAGITQFATVTVVAAILWLVLAKPAVDISALPDWMLSPGGLQSLAERLMPIP
jgi:putative membrane protein